jgi:DNA-binding PadR family transcriptional regulator
MSIRHGLLALLQREPAHGYQLRADFEAGTGATWPLNIGQVYSTLGRLERDGCVVAAPDSGGREKDYSITDTGRAELHAWFATPVQRADRPRDELAIKLAMALVVPGVDVAAVIQAQRSATLTTLRDCTRLKVDAPERPTDAELSFLLVLDSLIFAAQAEAQWLDHCEARLALHRPAGTPLPRVPAPDPGAPSHTGQVPQGRR